MTIPAHDPHTASGRRSLVTEGLAAGVLLLAFGIVLDHVVGVLAAVVGFVAIAVCLGVLADELSRHLPGGKAHHLSWRRWSGF